MQNKNIEKHITAHDFSRQRYQFLCLVKDICTPNSKMKES